MPLLHTPPYSSCLVFSLLQEKKIVLISASAPRVEEGDRVATPLCLSPSIAWEEQVPAAQYPGRRRGGAGLAVLASGCLAPSLLPPVDHHMTGRQGGHTELSPHLGTALEEEEENSLSLRAQPPPPPPPRHGLCCHCPLLQLV